MLRRLNRQVIVQEVNRSDAGDKIYKIHERFRRFLMQKHPNPTRDHRTALEHHFEELLQKIGEESDETWKEILPHSFHLRFHLTSLHDEVTPEYFLKETRPVWNYAPGTRHTGVLWRCGRVSSTSDRTLSDGT